MLKVTQRDLIRTADKRWRDQYWNTRDLDKSRKALALTQLDKDTATEEDVTRIIGNRSWTQLICDECGTEVESVVCIGGKPEVSRKSRYICKPCVERALKLFEEGRDGRTEV